ncbi:hypothetical protein MG293_005781 [Ovis ammon polii]|uniref:Uncharacterized protein n=1 Tax=Ovis ammon polii TaxID=230172 RepID=A0AAD4YC08_OVIAM|nr:hypothetical protein MG293_005781 [Ovis ammon polii]
MLGSWKALWGFQEIPGGTLAGTAERWGGGMTRRHFAVAAKAASLRKLAEHWDHIGPNLSVSGTASMAAWWVTSHMQVGNEKPFCRELNGLQEDIWGLVLIVPWSKARLMRLKPSEDDEKQLG